MHGLVIKNTGSWYTVHTDEGRFVECKVKGSFRLKGIRSTNPVVIGDSVDIEENNEGTAFITNISERRNYMIRRASNLSKQSHILAANIDLAALVITINYPRTTTVFIDRFLATAEAYRIPALLVFNKTDLYDAEDMDYLDALIRLYTTIGYSCMKMSALKGDGIDELIRSFARRTVLLSGHSGVGKSTVINKIIPDINIKTAEISDYHKMGMHTTTFSEMLPIPGGGFIIDTPGIKGFGTIEMEGAEVAHYFPEIFKSSAGCRFNNCIHTNEPGCAVLKAVEDNYISESRYKSYLSILEDKDDNKYRDAN